MQSDIKGRLLRMVEQCKGDDLERAERQYGRLSNDELKKVYGSSGGMCKTILEEYRKDRKEWEEVYNYVRNLPDY